MCPSLNPPERGLLHREDGISTNEFKFLKPAMQVGTVSGIGGLFAGAIAGIIRSTNPILFSLASGIQCFTLGSTIMTYREFIFQLWGKEEFYPSENLLVSSLAGALGGGTSGALLRGKSNVIPGAIMFALFTATGQAIYNKLENEASRQYSEIPKNSEKMKSWINTTWIPLRPISDKEYEATLNDKLQEVKAEISILDKKIAELRQDHQIVKLKAKKEEIISK